MWKTMKLGDVCELAYGKALDKKDRLEAGGYPAFGANGIKTQSKEPLFDKPSIIIGRKGSAGEINKVTEPFWALDVTYYTKIDEAVIDLDYFFHVLTTLNLPSLARGVKPGINRNDVYGQIISLPPLAEQQRIVAKLDAAFAEIDKAFASNNISIEYLSNLFSETVEFEIAQLKLKYPIGLIGDVVDNVQYGTSSKCAKAGEFPVLRMGNIQDGEFVLDDLVYLDDKVEAEKHKLSRNDVLFNRTNSPLHVGKCAIFSSDLDASFAGYLIRINYKKDMVNAEFLNYYLNSSSIRNHGYSVMTSSVNQANINGTKLKAYPFVLVAKSEQERVAKKLRIIKERIIQLQLIREIKRSNLNALKSSILIQELQPTKSEAA